MSFSNSLTYGRVGEKQVIDFLTKQGKKVEDVANGRKYDLFVDGVSIEVKRDSNIGYTGNIFAETITNIERNTLGWFNTSTAKYIFYISEKTNKCFIFELEDLREYQKEKNFTLKKMCDYSKTIQYFLVPLYEFQEWLIGKDKFNKVVQLEEPKIEW